MSAKGKLSQCQESLFCMPQGRGRPKFDIFIDRQWDQTEQEPLWNPPRCTLTQGLLNSLEALKGMDQDENFRAGMCRRFEQVCLAPVHGSVLTDEPPTFLRFTGVELNGALASRASGVFARMLSKQLDDRVSLSDIIDDSNLLRNNLIRNEEEEAVSESEGEGEGN